MRLSKKFCSSWAVGLLFAGLFFGNFGAAARAELNVEIVEPEVGVPLFDRITVAVRPYGPEALGQLEIWLDGRKVGTLNQAPWRLEVDAGSENREHLIEVVGRGIEGTEVRSQIRSPKIQVHEVVDLELQQLYLTVTDRRGERVLDLAQNAFTVRDDGQRQEIVTLAGGEIPFTAVMLLDSSTSMAGRPLEAALQGSRRFVAEMDENDEARLFVTSDRVLRSTPWADDPKLFDQPLGATQASGGSAILDHLFLALQYLEERQGRRVLILLSDGWDMHSALTTEQLRQVARRSQAMVYWVRLGDVPKEARGPSRNAHSWVDAGSTPDLDMHRIPLSVWRDEASQRKVTSVLSTMVSESGGRIVPIYGFEQVEAAFVDILKELREQVAVGYYPDPLRNDGSWREVKVRVRGRGLKVRTRKGYIDRQ